MYDIGCNLNNQDCEEFFSNSEDEVPLVSHEDIRNIYKFDNIPIGKGSFGSVRKACLRVDKKNTYAIKSISKKRNEEHLSMITREIKILKQLDHPSICKFYESYEDDKFIHIVMEYCSGSDLSILIDNNGALNESDAKRIFFQILCAINSTHANRICHRDIKPQNFLLFDQNHDNIKLIDFGLSTEYSIGMPMKDQVGTPWFVAPEVLKGNYDEKVDYWSAGVTLYYMLFGTPPFYDSHLKRKVIYEKICQADYSFPELGFKNISNTAKNIIRRMLIKDPYKRLSARDALNDMWFIPIQREYLSKGKKLISAS